jgi:hypothetical protein
MSSKPVRGAPWAPMSSQSAMGAAKRGLRDCSSSARPRLTLPVCSGRGRCAQGSIPEGAHGFLRGAARRGVFVLDQRSRTTAHPQHPHIYGVKGLIARSQLPIQHRTIAVANPTPHDRCCQSNIARSQLSIQHRDLTTLQRYHDVRCDQALRITRRELRSGRRASRLAAARGPVGPGTPTAHATMSAAATASGRATIGRPPPTRRPP